MAKRRKMATKLFKYYLLSLFNATRVSLVTLFALSGLCISFAQTGISTINTTNITGTSTNYTATAPSDAADVGGNNVVANNEYRVNNGQNNNIRVTSYVVSGTTYDNFLVPDTVAIRRTDGSRFINIWYELINPIPVPGGGLEDIDLGPDAVEDADLIYKNRNINSGYDNILVNEDDEGAGTIQAQTERVDIIWYTGITTCEPDNAIFPVIERGGNDRFQMAAITSLDANGDPDEFTSLVAVEDADWPGTGSSFDNFLILRRQNFGDDPLPLLDIGTNRGQSAQTVQGVAVSFTELGITANQVVYGYSLFGYDVSAASHDLTDISTFPSTTLASEGGLDLVAGVTAAVSSDNCLTPAVGPGGYKQPLATWLKANETDEVTNNTEGSSVSLWEDHWTGGHDFSTGAGTPTYRLTTSQINFNQTVDFTTSSTSLTTGNNEDFNSSSFYTKKGINIAFRTGNAFGFTNRQVIYEQGDETRGINIYMRSGNLHVTAWNRNSDGSGAPWNNGANVTTISSSTLSASTEYIVTLELNGNSSGTGTLTAYLNGQSIGSISNVGLLYDHSSGDIVLGGAGSGDGTQFDDTTTDTNVNSFRGQISEFIYCNEPSTFPVTQRRRIESYLAIKYGITLDQSTAISYYNSNGNIIFNTSAAASIGGYLEYNNDIAGIGRDDGSELEQLQSRSENLNSIITMSRSTSFPKDNTWLIWGNDGAAVTDTETSDVPPTVQQRIERIWRVAETNSSGNVTISFDLSELSVSGSPGQDDYSLIIAGNSSGGAFTSARVITGGTVSGNTLTFENVAFENGEYFSLGTGFITCGPGGVTSNLNLWLKANLGPNTLTNGASVTTWADRAGSNDATDAGNPPSFLSNAINFNPAIDFDGTNDRLDGSAGFYSNGYYLVLTPTNDIDNTVFQTPLGFDASTASANVNLGGFIMGNAFGIGDILSHAIGVTGGGTRHVRYYNNSSYVFNGGETLLFQVRDNSGATSNDIYLNGAVITDASNSSGLVSVSDEAYSVGDLEPNNGAGPASALFYGNIAEVISYNARPTDAENDRIESYLALKYGITLDQSTARDYVNSSGTTIWDGTSANDLYDSDVAGIGRDDNACLEQKQSKSINSGSIVTMGLGEISTSNATNTNSFSANNSFLIWGNDGGAANTPFNTVSQLPGNVTERLGTIWRVDETGTVGDVSISFDLTGLTSYTSRNNSDYQLIIGPNSLTPGTSDLSSASTYSGGVFDGDVITFNNIDFSDAEYFTLGTARESCGPGGVTAAAGSMSDNIELWLRANEGTNTTTDGANITSWSDQSGNARDAATANLGGSSLVSPTFETNEFNFNPGIRFYDPSSTNGVYMQTSGSHSVSGDMSIIVVFKSGQAFGSSTDFEDAPVFLSTGTNSVTTDYGVGIASGRLHANLDNNSTLTARSGTSPLYNTLEPFITTVTREQAASGAVNLYANSASVNSLSNTSSNTALNAATTWAIGNHVDGNVSSQLSGRIAEVLVFSEILTATERQRIESYLALKYGITRDVASLGASEQDYLASDGSTIFWDWSENTSYNSDIAGIGRDDGSCLAQTISKSENDDAMVTMQVASFGTDNSFLLWANDNAAIENPDNEEFNRASYSSRLNREWRVQETGTVGTTTITFDLSNVSGPSGLATNNLNQVVMLVDSDGDFSSGETAITSSSVDAVNKTITFQYNFTDGQFFTLASYEAYALPIELLSFNASAISDQVFLSWTTSSETNNSHFSIERSTNGETFESIGEIEGAGNSAKVIRYKFTDRSPEPGRNFYRLKQYDYNGNYSHTETKSVLIIHNTEYRLSIRPNPVRKDEKVIIEYKVPSNTTAHLSVISMQGQVLISEKLNTDKSEYTAEASIFSQGVYLVTIKTAEGKRLTERLIVTN